MLSGLLHRKLTISLKHFTVYGHFALIKQRGELRGDISRDVTNLDVVDVQYSDRIPESWVKSAHISAMNVLYLSY